MLLQSPALSRASADRLEASAILSCPLRRPNRYPAPINAAPAAVSPTSERNLENPWALCPRALSLMLFSICTSVPPPSSRLEEMARAVVVAKGMENAGLRISEGIQVLNRKAWSLKKREKRFLRQ